MSASTKRGTEAGKERAREKRKAQQSCTYIVFGVVVDDLVKLQVKGEEVIKERVRLGKFRMDIVRASLQCQKNSVAKIN